MYVGIIPFTLQNDKYAVHKKTQYPQFTFGCNSLPHDPAHKENVKLESNLSRKEH